MNTVHDCIETIKRGGTIKRRKVIHPKKYYPESLGLFDEAGVFVCEVSSDTWKEIAGYLTRVEYNQEPLKNGIIEHIYGYKNFVRQLGVDFSINGKLVFPKGSFVRVSDNQEGVLDNHLRVVKIPNGDFNIIDVPVGALLLKKGL